MKVMIINGTMREQVSYNIARVLAEMLAGEDGLIYELFMPKNLPNFCTACGNCLSFGEYTCPHHRYVETLELAMSDSQIVLFATPVINGLFPASLKNLFDHLAFRSIRHRPNRDMWNKQAVVVATAAHQGIRHTLREAGKTLSGMGFAHVYTLGFPLSARAWSEVRGDKRIKIARRLEHKSKRILKKNGKTRSSIKARCLFHLGRLYQKWLNQNKTDIAYWDEQGWFQYLRPWYIRRFRR